MKIIELENRQIFDIEIDSTKNECKLRCPVCSDSRKKSSAKVLSWNTLNNIGYCHHCGSRFGEYKPYNDKKDYFVPEPLNETNLSDKTKDWIVNKRFISQDVINDMNIYSANEWMPVVNKEVDVICFPYFRDGKLVNVKYRDARKNFKFMSGAELLFYNHDCIDKNDEIIITEGEFDALTYMVCGYNNVVSVPNGAKNFDFLNSYSDILKDKQLIISTDSDIPGQELKNEIVRRFGADVCKVINLEDQKDANDYFKKYTYKLKEQVENAEPVPVKGMIEIYSFRDRVRKLFEDGVKPGLLINRPSDEFITFETGRLMIVTGIPGHGKSHYVNDIVCRLNILHGWKAAYFTPENYPLEYHYRQLYEVMIGKEFTQDKCNDVEYDMAYEHIKNNFFYILNEDDMKPSSVIEAATGFVRRKGIKILVIDPYNKLEHQSDRGENETQYISRFLDILTTFSKLKDVLVILIAHPRKMQKTNGQTHDIPTLYDISGSANFYNKTDYGITVYRNRDKDGLVNNGEIHIQKIKFRHLGKTGKLNFKFNYNNGRFEEFSDDTTHWDNSNWLVNNIEVANPFETKEFEEIPF